MIFNCRGCRTYKNIWRKIHNEGKLSTTLELVDPRVGSHNVDVFTNVSYTTSMISCTVSHSFS